MSVETLERDKIRVVLNREDFASKEEVRWCPGCGDYAILATMQKVLAQLGLSPERHVFVSGIGCSSRFPYYLNTYGFHTIHGRAPAIATGLKMTQPDLSVWVITGDGDGLSIGTSHLIHLMRRNIDVTVLLFNNRIYGLTKGQYSPTSELGKKTKTSPMGNIDAPLNPIALALGAGCSFVGRAIDVDAQGLALLLKAAHQHKGTAFIEIYQNCTVFNDGAFAHFSEKNVRAPWTLNLTPNEPLLFGEGQYGLIREKEGKLAILELKTKSDHDKVIIHNEQDSCLSFALSQLALPEFPVPLGIFQRVQRSEYVDLAKRRSPNKACPDEKDLQDAFSGAECYSISI